MISRNFEASTSLYTIFCSCSLRPLTLKGMETNLNLATWAAMSSLMFSRSRHLSAFLGGGAARRPACANTRLEAEIINKRTGSQGWIFMDLILTTCRNQWYGRDHTFVTAVIGENTYSGLTFVSGRQGNRGCAIEFRSLLVGENILLIVLRI